VVCSLKILAVAPAYRGISADDAFWCYDRKWRIKPGKTGKFQFSMAFMPFKFKQTSVDFWGFWVIHRVLAGQTLKKIRGMLNREFIR